MRRRALLPLLLALAGLAPAAGAARARPDTAVGVGLREFHITPYRPVVPVGRVRFNLHNYGQDTHDFVVVGPGGVVGRASELRAGDTETLTVNARRSGTYVLVCTVADHALLGMRATVRVRSQPATGPRPPR